MTLATPQPPLPPSPTEKATSSPIASASFGCRRRSQRRSRPASTSRRPDAIFGKPMGIPKTGVFGLLDLVGLDLMPHINASLAATLPKEDAFHAVDKPVPLVEKLIAEGYTGRKGKGGFYRINREKGKRKEAIDLATGEFRASRKPVIEALGERKLARLLEHDSKHGRYAWRALGWRAIAFASA